MPSMSYYRGWDNELKRLADVGPDTDANQPTIGYCDTYFPDDSELAIANGIDFGRYDYTGGEVGNEE